MPRRVLRWPVVGELLDILLCDYTRAVELILIAAMLSRSVLGLLGINMTAPTVEGWWLIGYALLSLVHAAALLHWKSRTLRRWCCLGAGASWFWITLQTILEARSVQYSPHVFLVAALWTYVRNKVDSDVGA